MNTVLVITNVPNQTSAEALAEHLISARLAACVNIGSPVNSLYHWEGKLERTGETPVLIKTTAERYPALEAAIKAHHPYELPEIIAVPVVMGLEAYLDWIAAEVALPSTSA